MQNLKSLTNEQLLKSVEILVRKERELVESLIWHLQEIQDRKLFLELGYTSLFECLVKHYKYSEAVAYARISALRIMSVVPEAALALKQGEVTVTTLSLAQSYLRKQEKTSGEEVSQEDKIKVLELVKNKSTQEVKAKLAELVPVAAIPQDKIVYLDQDHVQLQITASKSLLEKIDRLKSLISHENIDPTYEEIINQALDALIQQKEKSMGIYKAKEKSKGIYKTAEKAQNENSLKVNSAPISSETSEEKQFNKTGREPLDLKLTQSNSIKSAKAASRYISRNVKRIVLQRSQGVCEHIHPDGKRCHSRFQLQYDHVTPFNHGGSAELGNIQLLCRVHNAAKGAQISNCSA